MNVRVVRAAPSDPAPRPPARAARSSAPNESRGNRRLAPRASDAEPGPAPRPRRTLRARFEALGARLRAFGARALGPLRVAFRVGVALALLASSVAVYRFVERYARTSPEFAIETLEITGLERVERASLEESMGLAVGDNVFSRSPEEVRDALERHPWIASARVRRRLPRTFEIEVRERVPALLLVLEANYLVDEEGTVFKVAEPGDPTDLPVMTGVDGARFRNDRSYRTELLTSGIALLREWQSASLARREPIAEIHVEPDEGLTLFVGDDGTEVRLGRGPYRAKLGRLRRVLDELGRRQSRPLYVYLDNVRRPDRVTVRVR
jgi:cell division protein FtsQ